MRPRWNNLVLCSVALLLLLAAPARASHSFQYGLDDSGMPIAINDVWRVSFNWEGELGKVDSLAYSKSAGNESGIAGIEWTQQRADCLSLTSGMHENLLLGCYLTPGGLPGQSQLSALTFLENSVPVCQIRPFQSDDELTVLDLDELFSGILGTAPRRDDSLECRLLAVAEQMDGALAIILQARTDDGPRTELGIWRDGSWEAAYMNPVKAFTGSGYALFGSGIRMDQHCLFTGPTDELLLLPAGNSGMNFLTRDGYGDEYMLYACWGENNLGQVTAVAASSRAGASSGRAPEDKPEFYCGTGQAVLVLGAIFLLFIAGLVYAIPTLFRGMKW
ncbi:MAG: hypothetical protein R3F46_12580 [bacterium]